MKLLVKPTVSFLLLLSFSSLCFAQADSLNINVEDKPDTIFQMQKSPWGAVLRSAVLPGWGQFYNESYLKIPVLWGIAGWLVYGWIQNNNDYKDNDILFFNTGNELYRTRRNFYRDQRDNFTIYIAILYLMNLIDAYVDAHLFDFTVEEDFMSEGMRLNLQVKF